VRRWIATTAAAGAALLALPASALAADSVSVDAGALTYVSGAGTADVISVSNGSGKRHMLTDWRSPSGTPGTGCAWAGMASWECTGSTRVSISTLDGDDAVGVYTALPATIAGGTGNDDLTGGPAADTIDAGDGDDKVETRDGVADTVDCGPGIDTVQADPIDVVVNCNDPLPTPVTPAGDPGTTPPPPPGGEVPVDGSTPPGVDLPGTPLLPVLGSLAVVVQAPPVIKVGSAGVVRFDLACAPTEVAGCKGVVYLDPAPRHRAGRPQAMASRRGRYGRSNFAATAGGRATVKLRLTASARRALGLPTGRKARMARRGRPVKVVVTVSQGGKKPVKSNTKLKH
jgi:hypothetical protein